MLIITSLIIAPSTVIEQRPPQKVVITELSEKIPEKINIKDSLLKGNENFKKIVIKSKKYIKPKSIFTKVSSKSYGNEELREIARRTADQYGMDYKINYTIATIESGWNPCAKSRTNDYGITQHHNDINAYCNPEYSFGKTAKMMSSYVKAYGVYDAFRAYNAGVDGMKNGKAYNYAQKALSIYQSI